MDEPSLLASIQTYKEQLQQVDQAIQAAGETEDLLRLRTDLQEIISLTEDSLLSLKKSELLRSLDTGNEEASTSNTPAGKNPNAQSDIDDEYAAFQAMLGEDVTPPIAISNHDSPSPTIEETSDSMSQLCNDIVGTKCRAPYSHDWGGLSYYNALIVGLGDSLEEDDMPKVRVMFMNPTHVSMQPCKYYLEDKCRFSDSDCRYSHGYCVDVSSLQEFQEPDYSLLQLGHNCLAKYDEDEIWYKAVVHDLHLENVDLAAVDESRNVTVTFEDYNETVVLGLEDILPLVNHESSESEEEEGLTAELKKQPISKEDSDEEEALPVFLWKPPPKGTGALGDWEQHTKGIGSKLMSKMGYVLGEGLGCRGNGRVLPVPIQLLPKGKSLDAIMHMKTIAGEQDLFDVLKKQEKKTKKQEEKQAKDYHKPKIHNMFDFINLRLGGKKGKLSDLVHRPHGQDHGNNQGHGKGQANRHISASELHNKSGRSINVQLLKTGVEMKSVRKELARLKESMGRHANKENSMAAKLRQKIQSLEKYLGTLQTSELAMEQHQKKRTDHKKLTVF